MSLAAAVVVVVVASLTSGTSAADADDPRWPKHSREAPSRPHYFPGEHPDARPSSNEYKPTYNLTEHTPNNTPFNPAESTRGQQSFKRCAPHHHAETDLKCQQECINDRFERVRGQMMNRFYMRAQNGAEVVINDMPDPKFCYFTCCHLRDVACDCKRDTDHIARYGRWTARFPHLPEPKWWCWLLHETNMEFARMPNHCRNLKKRPDYKVPFPWDLYVPKTGGVYGGDLGYEPRSPF